MVEMDGISLVTWNAFDSLIVRDECSQVMVGCLVGGISRISLSALLASARSTDSSSASMQNAVWRGALRTIPGAFAARSTECLGANDQKSRLEWL